MRALLDRSPLRNIGRLAWCALLAIATMALAQPAAAQTVTTWNAQQVLTGGGHLRLFETGAADTWSDGSTTLRELQRNGTSIQLQSADQTKSYLIDSSRNAVFADLNGTTPPSPILRTSMASGFTAAYLKFQLFSPSGHVFGDVIAEESRRDGISQGWTISPTARTLNFSSLPEADRQWILAWHGQVAFGKPFTVRPEAVKRTGATITIPVSPDLSKGVWEIDTLTMSGSGRVHATYIAPVTGRNVGRMTVLVPAATSLQPKPSQFARFTQTDPLKWRLEYPARNTVADWIETARTAEYLELRSPDNAVSRRYYMNGPTKVLVSGNWYDDPKTTVLSAEPQWNGQIGAIWENPPPGVSPGFQIVNKTDSPVLVTLEQVGCLYYGIVPPGQVFQRDTGAVWFTIKAAMAPNIPPPTDFDCAVTPALYAGSVLFAGATAGAGLAVPAMVFTALGLGAGYGIEAAVLASGGTVTEGEAARRAITFVTTAGVTVGYGMLQPSPDGVLLTLANAAAVQAGLLLGTHIVAHVAEQVNIDAINKDLMQQAIVSGAYAGPPWPHPRAERIMPRYDIVGGPRMRKLEDGTAIVLKQERPLTLLRVN
jgi:hypothetical protein